MTKSITERILGSTTGIKILDLLMDWKNLDYSIKDISEGAGISRQSAYDVVKNLLKYKILIKTRTVSNMQMYKYNKDYRENIIGKGLLELNKSLLEYQELQIKKSVKK